MHGRSQIFLGYFRRRGKTYSWLRGIDHRGAKRSKPLRYGSGSKDLGHTGGAMGADCMRDDQVYDKDVEETK